MHLVIFSYKRVWEDAASPSGYSTIGGFPMQIEALSELFDSTRIVVPLHRSSPPAGRLPLSGSNLRVVAVPEPRGSGLGRKLFLPFWLLRRGGLLWRECGRGDAVHALVPGDLGTLGLLAALARRKPLVVRHCGTWGNRQTLADRFLAGLLPHIAGGRRVILATGGGADPPKGSGGRASWIFSTSLSQAQMNELPEPKPWNGREPLRLVSVGRLTAGKNAAAAIEAMPEIRRYHPGTTLHLVGHGPAATELKTRIAELELEGAVQLYGNLDQDGVLGALRKSHLFVFPTRVAEGFPKAVLEAMACGLPILVPSVSVLPRWVDLGGGWLLEGSGPEATSAQAVARTVLAAVADPEELARRAASARKIARGYTLEAWKSEIRRRLEQAWDVALAKSGPVP